MQIDDMWRNVQQNGYAALADCAPTSALGAFYCAVLAFGHDDFSRAVNYARQAQAMDPEHLVFSAGLAYLEHVEQHGKVPVYGSAEAFGAFIRGGSNLPLYQAVSTALRQVYQQYSKLRLLDIGVGDGMALLPALTENITALTLVEPSADLLAKTLAGLDRQEVSGYQSYNEPLQSFVQHAEGPWDVAQATFSLQSIPPAERHGLLRWIRQHSPRFLLVEFDVPPAEHMYAPGFVTSIVERFHVGLAEYTSDRELIGQGFLMPIMFGYFDQTQSRTNYEQPCADWAADLQAAGFARVARRPLYNYWWSPAVLLDAGPA